ncbi:SGNH/GDSL hydrolase family protein [Actinomycetes bacterium KLBMP 9759]
MNAQATEKWLQHTHLEKVYGYLPGLADVLPAIFGVDRLRYEEIQSTFAAQARRAAEQLLAEPSFGELVDALPFRAGQTVLAVGDSNTDDLQSWAEILRNLLELRRPADGITIVNGGLSAHTTAMVLRRWPATLKATRPDHVICALGGNDVTRVGSGAQKTLVGVRESVANLEAMREIAGSDVGWTWLTPTPVDEERVDAFPPFRFGQSSWRNADIGALVDAMRELPEPVVDLTAAFGVPPEPALMAPDGVHLSIAGQARIAASVVGHPWS